MNKSQGNMIDALQAQVASKAGEIDGLKHVNTSLEAQLGQVRHELPLLGSRYGHFQGHAGPRGLDHALEHGQVTHNTARKDVAHGCPRWHEAAS